MNTQTTTQINQFLPSFLCSVSLICSAILLCVFSCSAILPCVPFHSAHLLPFLPHILFCILPYCFIPFLTRTTNRHTVCLIFFYTHPHGGSTSISLGKMKTTVQATETPTDRQLNCNHESIFLTDSKLSS
jgi:hypothetical protein